jgi:hypothetical protein
MKERNQKGAVLVASMVILALLSLLGAGSLLNATLDTQLAGNQVANKEAFYAAEAALDAGVGQAVAAFREQLRPFTPGAMADWTEPSTTRAAPALADPYDNPFNGYRTWFRVRNPDDPAATPDPYLYTTVQSGQGLVNFAYTYSVEGRAEPDPAAPGGRGTETIAETVQILETPLVQYYIFFNDHLSWHSGPTMRSWGRVHTNGNLYFAPNNPIWFRDYDDANFSSPNIITVSGEIRSGEYLFQNNTIGTRPNGGAWVRTDNLGTIPAVAGDYTNIDTSITPANQGTQEARFVDSASIYHVRTGVNRLPTASWRSVVRDGFYEQVALAPQRPDVDGMRITIEAGALQILFTPNGGAPVDVTDLVRNYEVDLLGNPVNIARWPGGARTQANNTLAPPINPPGAGAALPIAGTIVYCPESPVTTAEAGGGPYNGTRANMNPWYPGVLERTDPREGLNVDLTVIDLQRLQLWYRDYVDWWDGVFDLAGAGTSPSPDVANRLLLIYASRSLSGGGFATGTGAGNLQAIKIIGSRAGRTRQVDDRQTDVTLTTRTTLVTDNPVYLDGDLNAPSADTTNYNPGGQFGSAVVCDAVTLLSNRWGISTYNSTGGTYTKPNVTTTAYNTAIFAGRFDFRTGGNTEEAGIHNFTRFIENWSGVGCYVTGCLVNLWFSQQATAGFRCCGTGTGDVYNPPQRNFGWDVGFINATYWPPYVPSIYSVERQAWREQ